MAARCTGEFLAYVTRLMVSQAALDALGDPTDALVRLFNGELDDFPQKVAQHFSSLFSSSNLYDEVPILNPTHPPHAHNDRSLVRFRAMVQDTSLSQEMYLAKLSHGGCGGWGIGDVGDASTSELDYANLRQCHVIWAVSIPGESPWCLDALHAATGKMISCLRTTASQITRQPVFHTLRCLVYTSIPQISITKHTPRRCPSKGTFNPCISLFHKLPLRAPDLQFTARAVQGNRHR